MLLALGEFAQGLKEGFVDSVCALVVKLVRRQRV